MGEACGESRLESARVLVAVPFTGGAIVAADGHSRLVKTPWGLLAAAGLGATAALDRAEAYFGRLPPLGLRGVEEGLDRAGAALAAVGAASGRQGLVWLYSHEVDPLRSDDPAPAGDQGPALAEGGRGWLGAPVGIYTDRGGGPRVSRWGAVIVHSGGSTRAGSDLDRDADLYLQGGLDLGTALAVRLPLALATVAWVLREVVGGWGESADAPPDAEAVVGIHEAGHRYSVDRVGLRGVILPPRREDQR